MPADINHVMSTFFIRNAYVNNVSRILNGEVNEANGVNHKQKQEQELMSLSRASNPSSGKSAIITFTIKANFDGVVPKTHSEIQGALTGDSYIVNRSEKWCKNWQDPDLV